MPRQRKKPKGPTMPPATDRIMPTPERFQHDALRYGEETVFSELGGRGTSKALTHRVTTQRAIDRLARAKVISDRQHRAAVRFYEAWHSAGLEPRAVAAFAASGGAGTDPAALTPTERTAGARRFVRSCIAATGIRLSSCLIWIVGSDESLEDWARRAKLPANTVGRVEARTCLRNALDLVADHMGWPQ